MYEILVHDARGQLVYQWLKYAMTVMIPARVKNGSLTPEDLKAVGELMKM